MGDAKQIDFGGNTLVVNGIRVGATGPGQSGTELTGSEIALLDGITAGTAIASKALVVDSSINLAAVNNVSMTGDLTVDGAAGTGTATPGVIKLTTPELTVVDGDQLGRIDFSAPLESSGTDAILVGASIWAEADDTFAATVNDTDMVFATGLSEAATEKMRLSSSGVLTVSGAITPTGGVAAAGGFTVTGARRVSIGNNLPTVSTDGNDSTPVTTETYVSEVFVPCNMTVTGVALFNGSNVTGNVTVGLADSTGAPIAAAKSASTAGSGTDAFQLVPFATPYAAKGPATYFVQVQYDSGTARYNTHTIGTHAVTKQTSQSYGTFASFTPPTTFTTAIGNMGSLY